MSRGTGHADPAQLLQRAEGWAAVMAERGVMPEAAARVQELLHQSRTERLDTPDDPLLVAMLCGPTAVGKSSLINALAGAEISRPGLGAATSAAVLYVHERDDPARLFEYSQALGRLARAEASLVRHARDALLHKVLVDTPDLDSAMRQHRETTQALVHGADLVLFVTSPEKYKTMQMARWVAEQRPQRAISFVLNKWDRDALGLQHERRDLIEHDFRAVLAEIGFADPLIFKVSAVTPEEKPSRIENELPALAAWLEAGLGRSTAAAIQQRRQRAGWGRLAAALAASLPDPAAARVYGTAAGERLAEGARHSAQLVRSEAAIMTGPALDAGIRPTTPGLLGAWTRLADRLATAGAGVRAMITWGGAARFGGAAGPVLPFGGTAAAALNDAVRDLAEQAAAARIPLGPTDAVWVSESRRLHDELARLSTTFEAEFTIDARRPSFRRLAGTAALYLVETLILLVLLLALWRLAAGFATGDYASGALLLNTMALVVVLLLLGRFVAGLFFPPLQERFRAAAARRAESAIEAAWRRVSVALIEQLDAIEQLAQQGRDLLADIDRLLKALSPAEPVASAVDRLFGDAPPLPRQGQPVLE